MSAENDGERFTEQLVEAGVQIGWPTRLVSFGPDVTATVFALGFATRVAMSFGGVEPGDYRKIPDLQQGPHLRLRHAPRVCHRRVVRQRRRRHQLRLPGHRRYADPGGPAHRHHAPTSTWSPTCPTTNIVARAIEVRGLKVAVTEVPIPVAYGPAFEGERVRGDDIYLESGGGRTHMVEWITSKGMDEVKDGKVEVIGPEITDVPPGSKLPLAIVVEVAGRQMQEDYEPILERQIHHLINYAQGVMHIGQRDIAWLRVSKTGRRKGLQAASTSASSCTPSCTRTSGGSSTSSRSRSIPTKRVNEMLAKAKAVYAERDARIEGMTDETTDTYYSCTLCQSFAPSHVCVVTPERTGLCGSYNWMDCKASFEINPTGPNQPVVKGEAIDARLGQWKGVNEFVFKASRGKIDHYNFYSIINDPMTACGCMECIAAILPLCNGFMTVNRDFTGMTPCGMKFTTLAGTIGGGISTPGFVGHGKYNIIQRKFLTAEGGIKRLVWMPKCSRKKSASASTSGPAKSASPTCWTGSPTRRSAPPKRRYCRS